MFVAKKNLCKAAFLAKVDSFFSSLVFLCLQFVLAKNWKQFLTIYCESKMGIFMMRCSFFKYYIAPYGICDTENAKNLGKIKPMNDRVKNRTKSRAKPPKKTNRKSKKRNSHQLDLFPKANVAYVFGGASTLGKRKVARTILPNKWIHLCLKSQKAVGVLSLLHPRVREKIESLIRQKAKKFFVELNSAVNMGNHFHLKIRVIRKDDFIKFLKSITGLIARIVTGAKKGVKFGKFWDAIAYTRVLMSSFEELSLRGYFNANRIEREKGYQARKDYLDRFNKWLYGLKKSTSTA